MKQLRSHALAARLIVTLSVASLAVIAMPTSAAGQPSSVEWARKRIQTGLVQPLRQQESERERFSRSRQPPSERRVRILAAALQKDKKGRAFMPYVVDARYGKEWRESTRGCVYRKTGSIFVQVGDEYRPGEFLLGKRVKPVRDVCQAGG